MEYVSIIDLQITIHQVIVLLKCNTDMTYDVLTIIIALEHQISLENIVILFVLFQLSLHISTIQLHYGTMFSLCAFRRNFNIK